MYHVLPGSVSGTHAMSSHVSCAREHTGKDHVRNHVASVEQGNACMKVTCAKCMPLMHFYNTQYLKQLSWGYEMGRNPGVKVQHGQHNNRLQIHLQHTVGGQQIRAALLPHLPMHHAILQQLLHLEPAAGAYHAVHCIIDKTC